MRCTWNINRNVDRCRENATMEARTPASNEWRVMCDKHAIRFPEHKDIIIELPQKRLI